MLGCYTFAEVLEPGYGERIVRVHGGSGSGKNGWATHGVDLVTGERVHMPIGSRWDQEAGKEVKEAAPGWSWKQIAVNVAEQRAGLPAGALPRDKDNSSSDPWADQRLRDPVFIGVSSVLFARPKVVFYSVDWRGFVRAEKPQGHGARPARRSSVCGTQDKPFGFGGNSGSGDVERFCSELQCWLTGRWSAWVAERGLVRPRCETVAGAILADLREDYDREAACCRDPDHWVNRKDMSGREPVRSFEQILKLCGWTKKVLDECEAEVAAARRRLWQETAGMRPSFQPTLFDVAA